MINNPFGPLFVFVSILLSFASSHCFSQDKDFSKVEIETIQVDTQIFMLKGDGGNIGVFTGDDGVVLVDNQYAPLSEKIKSAVASLSKKPIEFVINTHAHGDHVGGNAHFSAAGAYIVSHENTRKHIVHADPTKEGFQPKLTFSDSIQFHYNNEMVTVFYVSHGHTDGDAIVHFKKANVFHMGDTFVRYGFPYIDRDRGGNTVGLIRVLDAVIAMADDNTKFIPGHGELASKADVIAFRDMLNTVYIRVKKGMDAGKSLAQILQAKPLEGFEKRGVKEEDFITVLYESIQQ